MDIASPKYLLYSYVIYLIVYLIGSVVYGFIKVENDSVLERLFKKNVIGLYISITLFSVIKTTFITINTGIIFIGMFWIFSNKDSIKKQFTFSFNKIDIYLSFALIVIIYSLFFFNLYDINNKQLYLYAMDMPVYTTFVERLCKTGVETTANTFYFKEPIRNLYHYGDLWLQAFYSTILKSKPVIIVSLIYPVQLITVLIIGSIAFFQRVTQKFKLSLFHILIGFSIIILSGINWYIPRDISYFDSRWQEDFIVLNSIKFLLINISLLWVCIEIYKKAYKNIAYLIAVCMSMYFVSAPSLLITYFVFMFFLIFRKSISLKQALVYAIPLIINLSYILVYIVYTNHVNSIYLTNITKPIVQTFDIRLFSFYKTMVSIFLDTSVRVTISISLYILCIIIFLKKIIQDKVLINLLFFLLTLIYSSIFSYAILNFSSLDSFQFWASTSIIAVCLLLLVVFSLLFDKNKVWSYAIVFIVVVSCLYNLFFKLNYFDNKINKYNKSIAYTIGKKIQKEDNTSIAIISSPRDSTEIWGADRNIYVPYDFLHFYTVSYQPICLSIYDMNINETDANIRSIELMSLYNSVFYRFVEKQKYKKSFVSIDQSQIDFIKQYNIRYLIITPNSRVSTLIKNQIRNVILDSISGNQFCELK